MFKTINGEEVVFCVTHLKILHLIQRYTTITRLQISQELQLSPSTLNEHLQYLIRYSLITRHPQITHKKGHPIFDYLLNQPFFDSLNFGNLEILLYTLDHPFQSTPQDGLP